jgi:hypothetical protein
MKSKSPKTQKARKAAKISKAPKLAARPKPVEKAKSGVGRKSLLTPEISEMIIGVVKAGNYLSDAAEFVGLSAKTV